VDKETINENDWAWRRSERGSFGGASSQPFECSQDRQPALLIRNRLIGRGYWAHRQTDGD